MARLGVNIDHVATVRQARRTDEPDPVWAAVEAELGGADGITFHLREDRRHVNDRDARLLCESVSVKLNMEMSVAPDIVDVARELKPDQCTLVPERREELTTEGGLDVEGHRDRISQVISQLQEVGITLCAFIEPIPKQIDAAAKVGFTGIELWTGGYARARIMRARAARARTRGEGDPDKTLTDLRAGIEQGRGLGLEVHGGHGLTYRNVEDISRLRGFGEFNIGHSIVARAMFVGMREAVSQMKALLLVHAPKGE